MELVALITVLGGVVAILGFLYLLFIGQKSLFEWWRERQETHGVSAIPVTPPEPQVPTIPSNLPAWGEFIGREKEKARVREALASRWPLTCIDGFGGIGKTALALEATSECLRASKSEIPANGIPTFGGFIWTTAKDRELVLNDVLDAIARTFDYPGIAQQPLEEKQESVRKLLQSKRYLLIVDNFDTITDDAVRDFLLRLPEPSKALITSRYQLPDLMTKAHVVSLDRMEPHEGLSLIRGEGRRLGLASVEKAEERVLLHLYQATGGAPLAIKWAVGQIKQKGQALDTALAALHEARGDIFEEIFARSWSLLTDDARRILMVMPIFAASASRAAIEAASDAHHYALDEGLGQLVEMWLVEASEELDAAKRRYSIHPLTRAFAGARLREDRREERETRLRMARYFLNYAQSYGGSWRTYDELEPEIENILAAAEWCYLAGKETGESNAWRILNSIGESMRDFLRTRGYWDKQLILLQYSVEASRNLQEWESLGLHASYLGWLCCRRGELDAAERWASECLYAMQQTGKQYNIAVAPHLLGMIALRRKEYGKAESFFLSALDVLQKSKGMAEITVRFYDNFGAVQGDFGVLAYESGDYKAAEERFKEALAYAEEVGDLEGIAVVLAHLAGTAHKLGDLTRAWRLYVEGIKRAQEVGLLTTVARCKRGLAEIIEQEGEGELLQALSLARESLMIYARLGRTKDTEQTRGLVARLEGKLSADR